MNNTDKCSVREMNIFSSRSLKDVKETFYAQLVLTKLTEIKISKESDRVADTKVRMPSLN